MLFTGCPQFPVSSKIPSLPLICGLHNSLTWNRAQFSQISVMLFTKRVKPPSVWWRPSLGSNLRFYICFFFLRSVLEYIPCVPRYTNDSVTQDWVHRDELASWQIANRDRMLSNVYIISHLSFTLWNARRFQRQVNDLPQSNRAENWGSRCHRNESHPAK